MMGEVTDAAPSGAVEEPTAPSRLLLWVMTVLYLATMPVTLFVAFGAMVATVMGVSSAADGLGVTGLALTLVGIVLMLIPPVLFGAVIALWIAERRGSHRMARRLALVPLPFLVASLTVAVYIWVV